ncbi:outer membrane transport protein, OMPP1/FadL/TodX family [Janthinobacterium lividum]|uniref:Outer membrane transport protein, OMPP1/FadL/TodX family n=1 Tax=Janthinobacterium lividum TaxID=29581 RepID=A0A1S1UB90_9BURK|nr:OmpP1/FadL family transporter [Janthinobacterium lividum]OHV97695.1 outer membrane transport protein, OMPP1/FadL/TodX family [Janthinobacterium lividum]
MKHKYLPLLIIAAFAGISSTAQASGYRFGSQSVSAQGTADASGAEAADASTIFYNPAGLSRLEGTQFVGGGTLVVPHSTFQDKGSFNFTRTPTGGTTKDYVPDVVFAPAVYASKKIDEQWTVGMGLFVPYGAKLDYGNSWSGRYAITNIKLEAIALNPSVSFKLDQHHSFGFGVTAEYMKAELGQAVDVPGTVKALSANPVVSGAFLASVAKAQGLAAAQAAGIALAGAKDGHASMDGDDWGFGFNLGYLYQMNEGTRFGISYRSSISHKLKGDTIWDFSQVSNNAAVNGFISGASGKVNSKALVELRTPETVSINAFHQMDDRWALMGDVTWTRTSRLQNLDIQFPPTAEGAERIRQNWKDTYRVSLGTNYKYSENLMLRAGIAHDQAPVRSAELRHPALPDSDRMQYSIGANWKLNANSSIDLAYSYIDFKDAEVNYTNDCSPVKTGCTGNGETTKGLFKTRMQLIGLAYNYKF